MSHNDFYYIEPAVKLTCCCMEYTCTCMLSECNSVMIMHYMAQCVDRGIITVLHAWT